MYVWFANKKGLSSLRFDCLREHRASFTPSKARKRWAVKGKRGADLDPTPRTLDPRPYTPNLALNTLNPWWCRGSRFWEFGSFEA